MRSDLTDTTDLPKFLPPLKRLRLCAGIDVIEVAAKVGYSPSALRNIERGRRKIRAKAARTMLTLYGILPTGRALTRYFVGLC